MATRKSSEKILSHLVEKNKFLIGGSADLSGSNNTKIKSHKLLRQMILKEIIYTTE